MLFYRVVKKTLIGLVYVYPAVVVHMLLLLPSFMVDGGGV